MVKYSAMPGITSPHKIRIPPKLLLFWYKKISSYLSSQKSNPIKDRECPTIYISKRYPKMTILELYQRIEHHLMKYFPNIYHKINSKTKKCLIKIKKNPLDSNLNENIIKNDNESNNEESNKKPLVLINSRKRNKYTENILLSNEKNCSKIKHLFESHKFDDDIYEKYDKCYIKEILIKDPNNNNNDNDDDSNSSNLDDITPFTSTSYSSSNITINNKVNFLTHLRKIPRKSKYFNNDDYYSNKLKSIGNYNIINK